MDPADLEREIHEALIRLRAPRAPGLLSPRVMTAVRAHLALPWYRRSWFSWPVGWQVAGVVAALVMVAVGAMLVPAALGGATTATTVVAQNVGGALAWEPPEHVRRVLEMAGAARVVWRTVLGPLVYGLDPLDEDSFVPLFLFYRSAFWAWKGATVGGIICQLRVARMDGAPLGAAEARVRGLGSIFSIAVLGIGCLWILRDSERQAWHDKIAGTCVVKVPRSWPL